MGCGQDIHENLMCFTAERVFLCLWLISNTFYVVELEKICVKHMFMLCRRIYGEKVCGTEEAMTTFWAGKISRLPCQAVHWEIVNLWVDLFSLFCNLTQLMQRENRRSPEKAHVVNHPRVNLPQSKNFHIKSTRETFVFIWPLFVLSDPNDCTIWWRKSAWIFSLA